jgi:hypothetical protein
MENRIIKIVLENGLSIEYKEKGIEYFKKKGYSEGLAKSFFFNQHKNWEKETLSYFGLDIEEYAKNEYDLIDSDEKRDINDFDDDDLLSEAEIRGILPASAELQNSNILNEDFIERFVTIVNRGDIADIDNTLSFLEFKYKIS